MSREQLRPHSEADLRRGAVEIIKEEELRERLKSGRPLRIKAGFDPTSPHLHLGHLVLFEKLRQFQAAGHQAVLILGDFTATIGDPSGHDQTRPALSTEQIESNTQAFLRQLGKILDLGRVEIRRNSEWTSGIGRGGAGEFLRWLLGVGAPSVTRLMDREEFQNRKARGEPIFLTQLLYPVFQAYDSVAVRADVELGGTDQKFNLLLGRDLQLHHGQPAQIVMLFPLLVGTDGVRKMSKSWGNHVAFEDPPAEIFGKVMSVSDEVAKTYADLLAPEVTAEVADHHPMEFKKRLAAELVRRLHGEAQADAARADFETKFQNKSVPTEVPEVFLPADLPLHTVCDALAGPLGLVSSKSEARRLVRQKGVRINQVTVEDERAAFRPEDGMVVQVGRRRFVKVRIRT